MIEAELLGGPLDGQTMRAPSHVLFLRIPVPGSARLDHIPFNTDILATSSFWAATYERVGFRGHTVLFGYAGQELVS